MKENQIKVKKIKTGTKTILTIKNGMVYDRLGKRNVYCGCTGNTEQTATPMQFDGVEVYCPKCHEKKVEVLQTYEEWKTEKEEQERVRNEEKLANLHIVEQGSDWECGFKYYGLSANIEYEDWLKVKKHFRYYKRGWSRGQELEWNYGEPTGWLTTNPEEVEKILVEAGLIKSENTMKAIQEREEKARQEKKQKEAKNLEKREEIKRNMDHIEAKITNHFTYCDKVRQLSDAEANEHYFNPDFGKCTVVTYTITDSEIIRCRNMGDFKYGYAIPYSKNLKNLILEYYELNKELLNC